MTAAFNAACLSLHLSARDDPVTEIVALSVIEIAGTGERDPERIFDLVLLALNDDKRTVSFPRWPVAPSSIA